MPDLNTYPNDEFLHEKFVAPTIQKYLQGKLLGESLAIVRDIGEADSVEWLEEKYSDYGDPLKMSELREREDSALFPHVKFSGLEVKSAALHAYGLEIDFSEKVRRNKSMIDFIQRGYNRASYWLARLYNTLVFNSMTNSWSTTLANESNDEPWNRAADAVWSGGSANAPGDSDAIALMVEDTEGYDEEVDLCYLRKDNFVEFRDYLQRNSFRWAYDPKTFGKGKHISYNGIVYRPVHKLSGIPDSTALFIASASRPTTLYERTDPMYAKVKLRDNNGNALPGSWHTHKYFTDEDHVTHIQIWRESYPVTNRWGRKQIGILRTL